MNEIQNFTQITRENMESLGYTDKDLPEWFDWSIHRMFKNGVIALIENGRIITNELGVSQLDTEKAHRLVQIREHNKLKDKLIGMIEGVGLSIDDFDDLDEIARKASSASQAVWKKATQLLMEADKLTGVEGLLNKLFTDKQTSVQGQGTRNLDNTLAVLMTAFIEQSRRDDAEVIDGEVK